MEESSRFTNHKCAHAPCNCTVAPAERYCSDHCESHAGAPREDAGMSHGTCACGHPECGEPSRDVRA